MMTLRVKGSDELRDPSEKLQEPIAWDGVDMEM
jgi:hypothetical protein